MSAKKNHGSQSWSPDALPKEQSETRSAAAAWLCLDKSTCPQHDLLTTIAHNLDSDNADAFISKYADNPHLNEKNVLPKMLKECFPNADLKLAEALVKHHAPYQDVSEELLNEVLESTHTVGYEIIPWREASLRILATEFLAALKSSSAQLSEDAVARVATLLDEKLRGTTKNACQFISGQRTRLRKEMRMLAIAMLYLQQYREVSPETNQEDVMQLVKTCPDPDFSVDEFPFDSFLDEHNQINARGRYAFCEALKLVRGLGTKRDEIDEIIQNSSKRWRISRMSLIDLNILRLAAYELIFDQASTPRILINEAIELAKVFGAEQSKSFVNGILQQLCNDNNIKVV